MSARNLGNVTLLPSFLVRQLVAVSSFTRALRRLARVSLDQKQKIDSIDHEDFMLR